MATAITKLLDIAGPRLSKAAPVVRLPGKSLSVDVSELELLLVRKNGFYAFEGALHLFGSTGNDAEVGLSDWNSDDLWIEAYQSMASDRVFFAEDVFGCQFCLGKGGVFSFDPETAKDEIIAETVEGWACAILDDFEVLTGYPMARRWQEMNGILQPGNRLVPKVPFVTGGEFSVENLVSMNSAKAMRLRAGIAVQLRDLPDGTPIEWRITD